MLMALMLSGHAAAQQAAVSGNQVKVAKSIDLKKLLLELESVGVFCGTRPSEGQTVRNCEVVYDVGKGVEIRLLQAPPQSETVKWADGTTAFVVTRGSVTVTKALTDAVAAKIAAHQKEAN